MGILTKKKKGDPCKDASFNPLHRGMGILTGIDRLDSKLCSSFNPLHRGMGILTTEQRVAEQAAHYVSIPFIGAWVFLLNYVILLGPHSKSNKFQSPSSGHGSSYLRSK